MAKSYDATARRLLELDPPAWLACAGLDPSPPVRVIDSDVSTVTAGADTVFRVGEPPEYLAHFELQSGRDKDLPRRLLHYNVLLNYRHRLPVRTVAFLLRPQADGPELDGVHRVRWSDGTAYLDFRYDVVRVWELDVEAILHGGLGTLPLAPLAGVAEDQLPGVIGRMKERLDREVRGPDAGLYWSATGIMMGLKFPKDLAVRLLQGVREMKESVVYQAILEEGRVEGLARGLAEGRVEGRAEGRAEGGRELLLELGEERFGRPDAAVLEEIGSITDPGRIKVLTRRLLHASSWAELLGSP